MTHRAERLERGIVAAYLLLLLELARPLVLEFGLGTWMPWPALLTSGLVAFTLWFDPAKFLLLIVAGVHLVFYVMLGAWMTLDWLRQAGGGSLLYLTVIVAGNVLLPIGVIYICKQAGPFGSALGPKPAPTVPLVARRVSYEKEEPRKRRGGPHWTLYN